MHVQTLFRADLFPLVGISSSELAHITYRATRVVHRKWPQHGVAWLRSYFRFFNPHK